MWAIVGSLLGGVWSAVANLALAWLRGADEQKLGQSEQRAVDEAVQVRVADDAAVRVAGTVAAERDALVADLADLERLREPDPDSRD